MRAPILSAARLAAIAVGAVVLTAPVFAQDQAAVSFDAPKPPSQHWSFEGIFGTYDRAAAQRGFQVYKEVCAACHNLRFIFYRDLKGLGYNDAEVAAIAAGYETEAGPNDKGEMFKRPGQPSDRFAAPFPNDAAARASNNGALPVDLSVVIKAREHGPDYLYALLTGYKEPPAGFQTQPGMSYNAYFAGHQIAMPQPLNDGQVAYGDGTQATVAQMAKDVVTFLAWTAEPEMEARKAMGIKVILFLIILTGLLYAVKRKVWKDVH